MSTLRCRFCGMANFATQAICKQCKQPLHGPAQTSNGQSPRKAQYRTSDAGEIKGQQTSDSDASPMLDGVWRDGSVLVMSSESALPARCVRCNAAAPELYERKLSWNPTLINVMVGVSIFPLRSLVLLVISLILLYVTRRTTRISVGLCESHSQKRTFGVIVGGGLIALGLGMGIYIALTGDYWTIPWAIMVTLAGAFATILLKDTLIAKKIEEPYVWVKGINGKFLDSLPAVLR